MLASICAFAPRATTRLVFLPFKIIHLSLQLSLWLIVLTIGNLSKSVTPISHMYEHLSISCVVDQ